MKLFDDGSFQLAFDDVASGESPLNALRRLGVDACFLKPNRWGWWGRVNGTKPVPLTPAQKKAYDDLVKFGFGRYEAKRLVRSMPAGVISGADALKAKSPDCESDQQERTAKPSKSTQV